MNCSETSNSDCIANVKKTLTDVTNFEEKNMALFKTESRRQKLRCRSHFGRRRITNSCVSFG